MVSALIFNPDAADQFLQRTANSGFVIGEKIQFARLVFNFQSAEHFKDFNFLPGKFGINKNFSPVETQRAVRSDFFRRAFTPRKIFQLNESQTGLPTVKHISDKLNVSPGYLSDMLRTITGQNAQQHIHNKLIEKAKEALTTTSLSVGEIAYRLGFEHSQSFSKLFKNKTRFSPIEFRNSFN